MAKWHTITTDWPGTTLPSGWNGYGSYSVSANKLRFPITGSNYAGCTYYGQDLLSSHLMCRVEPGATGYASIDLYDGGTIRAQIIKDGTTIAFKCNGSTLASLTYSATDHAWWRIREASGTIYFETSLTGADGSWTVRASAATPLGMDTADCDLSAGGGSATSQAAFSKFNMVPASSGASVTGTALFSLGGLNTAAAGRRNVTGTALLASSAPTITAAGRRGVAGQAQLSLGGLTLTAAGAGAPGSTDVLGLAWVDLGGLGLSAAGKRGVRGTAAVTGPVLTLAAFGTGAKRGSAVVALGGLSLAAQGRRGVQGWASLPLGGLTLGAQAGPQDQTGTALVQLGTITLHATGQRHVTGTAVLALGSLHLTALGPFDVTAAVLQLRLGSIGLSLTHDKALSLAMTLAGPDLTLRQVAP